MVVGLARVSSANRVDEPLEESDVNARNLVCWAVVLVVYAALVVWGNSQPISMEAGTPSAWARLWKRVKPVPASRSETGAPTARRKWTPLPPPVPPAMRADAEQAIRASRCVVCAQELLPRLQRSIRLSPLPLDDGVELAKGASRFGGVPDVPAGFDWPLREGEPLGLIAQIQLSEVAGFDEDSLLPKTGWLCFFYALHQVPPAAGRYPADRSAWQVVYFDGDAETLARMSSPAIFPPCGMRLWKEWTLPSAFEEPKLLKSQDCTPSLYGELCWNLTGRFAEPGWHHLLGYAENLSPAMRPVCQMAANGVAVTAETDPRDPKVQELVAGTKEWMLLLQVELSALEKLGLSDDKPQAYDSRDRLYYWIRAQDLSAADFSQVWIVRQGLLAEAALDNAAGEGE